jgi:hypothetical protein
LLFYDPVVAGPWPEIHSTLVVRNPRKNHGFSAEGSRTILTALCQSMPRSIQALFSTIVAESVNSLYQNPLFMPARPGPKIDLANQGTAIDTSYSPHEGMFSRS